MVAETMACGLLAGQGVASAEEFEQKYDKFD